MLPSVKAIQTLNTSCSTLLHWQAEKDKGNKIPTGIIPKWVEIVTTDTAKAKAAVMSLNLDNFLLHAQQLVEYDIDTVAIQSIQLVASKPDFSVYSRLKQQLKLYEDSTSYVLQQAGKIASTSVKVRTVIGRVAIREAVRVAAAKDSPDFKTPKIQAGYGLRVKGNSVVNGLLKQAKTVQPAIDLESDAIMRGKLMRKARQDDKGRKAQADKFLAALVK